MIEQRTGAGKNVLVVDMQSVKGALLNAGMIPSSLDLNLASPNFVFFSCSNILKLSSGQRQHR